MNQQFEIFWLLPDWRWQIKKWSDKWCHHPGQDNGHHTRARLPPRACEASQKQPEENVLVQTGLHRGETDQAETAPSDHPGLSQLRPSDGPGQRGEVGGGGGLLQEEDRVGLLVGGGSDLVLYTPPQASSTPYVSNWLCHVDQSKSHNDREKEV